MKSQLWHLRLIFNIFEMYLDLTQVSISFKITSNIRIGTTGPRSLQAE